MLIDGGPLIEPAGPLDRLADPARVADPDSVAVTSAVGSLTWRQLDRSSAVLAGRYRDLGLEPGDRLASLMPNRVELLVHYLACFKAGLVATPLNYRYTAREIDHALEVSGAKALVVHVERAEDLAQSERVPGLRAGLVTFGEPAGGPGRPGGPGAAHRLEELLAADAGPVELDPPDPSSPAAIFFTSGSTGPAKGVTHSHETLRWMFASVVAAMDFTAADVCLPGSSMSHIGAFMFGLSAMSAGAPVVVARSYDAHELLPLLRAERPTVLTILPAALTAIIRDHDVRPEDFACLRICRAGADKVSTELLTEFAELAGFQIDEGYGMTEVGLATLNPPAGIIKPGSIG
ncbi:MAG TPA: class I adenylate-forming enzyme family protein, partial [Acidimicrobiales bacterium]|nr:class I adenylate-forming enzyme family protein [Acidimicrobiales bacterium]